MSLDSLKVEHAAPYRLRLAERLRGWLTASSTCMPFHSTCPFLLPPRQTRLSHLSGSSSPGPIPVPCLFLCLELLFGVAWTRSSASYSLLSSLCPMYIFHSPRRWQAGIDHRLRPPASFQFDLIYACQAESFRRPWVDPTCTNL